MNDDDYDEEISLEWTRAPNEPGVYSDWTIEVFAQEQGEEATTGVADVSGSPARVRYAVHRNMVGIRSLYFHRVFANRNQAFCEGTKRESTIPLPRHAMEAFEDLLDFFYSSEEKLTIGTSNAVGLYFLSDYLQIRTLTERVESFINRDMGVSTCASYFQQAKDLHIQCLLDRVALFCCNNPSALSDESGLWAIADIDLWKAVLKSQNGSTLGAHNWSPSLARFLLHKKEEWVPRGEEAAMDSGVFQELTDPDLLPIMSGDAALIFLSFEKTMQLDCVDWPNGTSTRDKVKEEATMTSFQERCVLSLNGSWKEQCMNSLGGKLRSYSPMVLESLLISSVEKQVKLEAENTALSTENRALSAENTALSARTTKLQMDFRTCQRENMSLNASNSAQSKEITRLELKIKSLEKYIRTRRNT